MREPVTMVEVWRGDVAESHHRGHAVVCDARGTIRAAWGDPDAVILPRSSCKMLQALPLLESGAGEALTGEQLALACASHSGAEMHVTRVAAWLDGHRPRRARPALRPAGARGRRRAPPSPRRGPPAEPAPQQLLGQARRLPDAERAGSAAAPSTSRSTIRCSARCGRLRGDVRRARARLGHRRLLGAELRHHGPRPRPRDGAHGRPARPRARRARRRRGGWSRRCSPTRCWSPARGAPARS